MSSIRRDVLVLSLTQVGFAGLLSAVGAASGAFAAPGVWTIPLAVAFVLAGSVQVNIELRRAACGVSFSESALVVGLLWLGPADVVLAAVIGEAVFCLTRRQPAERMIFNVSAVAAMAVIAALTFALLPTAPVASPGAWLNASVAALVYGITNLLSTVLVLTSVEGHRFRSLLAASALPAGVATGVATSLGVLVAILLGVSPWAVMLVAPVVAIVVLDSRRVASHRADRLRFERLYDTTARTASLQPVDEALVTAAHEARALVTGQAAICCIRTRTGEWRGVVVDDEGSREAGADVVAAVLALRDGDGPREAPSSELPADVRRALPPFATVVVASTNAEAAAPLMLAVLRDIVHDHDAGRSMVLDAFVGHAALTITNALLYEDVERALATQIDLNAEKDNFLAVVSHELRTPLAAIVGAVDTLRRFDDTLPAEQRAMLLDMAVRRGELLQRLIQELLLAGSGDRAGETVLQIEDGVDVGALVADITADLRQKGAADLDVQFEADDRPALRTDRDKLRHVLANLIENASKYAPGSPVEVTTTHRDEMLAIEVVDHGPGIPEADRERVFERFVQLDQSSTRRGGGTGLGLFLCRRLAEALGGTLTLSDAPGGGCRFTLELPAAAPAPSAPADPVQPDEHLLVRPN